MPADAEHDSIAEGGARNSLRIAQLEAILASTSDAVVSLDTDLRVITWNQSAEALFGYDEREAVGRSIERLIIPDSHLVEYRAKMRGVIERRQLILQDTIRKRADGSLVPVSVKLAPMLGPADQVIGAIIIYRDLRKQKSAEKAVYERAARLADIQGALAGADGGARSVDEPLPETTSIEVSGSLDDPDRLAAIEATGLIGAAGTDMVFDQFAELARHVLEAPMALVSIVLPDRQVFACAKGLPASLGAPSGTPISQSYCRHVVAGGAPIVVSNAEKNPLVAPCGLFAHGLTAYLGVPIVSTNGQVLGSFCVLDDKRRTWTTGELSTLAGIAKLANQEISNRSLVRQLKMEAADRERREARLRENQARYRAALRAGRLGSWEVDGAAGRRYWTPEALELFRIDLADGIGTVGGDQDELAARVHPDDRHLLDVFHDAALSQDSFPAEYRILLEDGSVRWISGHGQVLSRDRDGKPLRSVHIAADITERVKSEEAIRASEERLRLGLNVSGLVIADINYQTNSIQFTAEGAQLYGIGDGALTVPRRTVHRIFHPDDREEIEKRIRAMMEPGGAGWFEIDHRILWPNGEERWLRVRKQVFFSDDGKHQPKRGILAAIDITNRQRAEQALRRSEEEFRTFFEDLAVGASEVDLETRKFRIVNRRMCAITGYNREELIGGMSPFDLIHPDDLAVDADRIERFFSGSEPSYVGEKRYIRKDGGIRWVRTSSTAICDEYGRTIRCPTVVEDITARKQAEEDVLAAQEKLETALEAAGQGVWDYDIVNDRIDWDARTYELFGVPEGENISFERYARDLVHPDDRERYRTVAKIALEPKGTGELRAVHRILDPDGEIVWVSVLGRTQFAGEGAERRAVRMSGTVRDVTAARLAEQSLIESERRFSTMANNLPLMVWVHGPDGKRQFVNDTFCRYFGVTREQIDDVGWELSAHPEDLRAYTKAFVEAVGTQSNFHAEFRACDAQGEWRWLESWARPHFDESGKYLGHIGASADITERKQAEVQNDLLMKEVNHRSKNLLTVVQSIARNSARDADPKEFATDFSQRLQGLSASQDLLIDGDWTAVGLADLAYSQLRHLGDVIDERVKIPGNQVLLTPAAAQGIGMALHELATNALKYGALSGEHGTVLIEWERLSEEGVRWLQIRWIERGGPQVTQPTKKGFGRTVIERMAAHAVGGDVELRHDPEGVRWTLTAPEENVVYRVQ